MTSSDISPQLQALYERCYLYAALHGGFAPPDAVLWANDGVPLPDMQMTARLLALLRPHCIDTGFRFSLPIWEMRLAARHYALDSTRFDTTTLDTPIARARMGTGAYAPANLRRLIDNGAPASLPVIVGVLDRAGPDAPGARYLPGLRALLDRQQETLRAKAMLDGRINGHETELDGIAALLERPQSAAPLRALYVSGMAGIGKSHLLERAIQRARLHSRPVIIRLDFQEVGPDVRNAEGFYAEIARQAGAGMPQMAPDLEHAGSDRILQRLAKALVAADRPLFIVLDSLERLRSDGESHIALLFERLDRLICAGVPAVAILAAGRGDALQPAPGRQMGASIVLSGLDAPAFEAHLRARGVPPPLWPRIAALTRRTPLAIPVAQRAVAIPGFRDHQIPPEADPDQAGARLYRAVLRHAPDNLRRISLCGPVLRRLSQKILHDVLAPTLPPEDLQTAYDTLCQKHWLTVPDAQEQVFAFPTIRRTYLPLLYASMGAEALRVNRAAATWHDANGQAIEALYHRLQATRGGDRLPDIPADLALRFDALTLEELPARARDAIRHAQGARSDHGRIGAPPGHDVTCTAHPPLVRFEPARNRLRHSPVAPEKARFPDPRAIEDMRICLSRADLREAEFVLQHGLDGWVGVADRGGLLLLAQLWLSGRWSLARRLHRMLGEEVLKQALADSPAFLGRLLLDIEAEFAFDRLVRRLKHPDFAARALLSRHEGTGLGLAGGALDLALLCAVPHTDLPRHDMQIALGLLAHKTASAPETVDRLRHLAALRRGDGVRPEAPDDASLSRELSPLNPYHICLDRRMLRPVTGALARFCARGQTLPQAAAHLETPPETPLPARFCTPRDLIAGFGRLGLGADWALGFTFFNPVPDLPELARAAGRWQRVLGADWCMGRARPAGWAPVRGPDRITRSRARDLLQAPDPVAAARHGLFFWAQPTHSPAQAAAHLRRRLGPQYHSALAALPEAPPHRRLALALNVLRAPAPMMPALAVLLAHGIEDFADFNPTNSHPKEI